MKKIIILSLIAISLAAAFSACTTYDEGPGFTMLPANMRIQGEWDQVQLYINDDLQEDSNLTVEFVFNSDNTGTRTAEILGFTSETEDIDWKFNDDKTQLLFKDVTAEAWDSTTILRLTNKELWIIDDAGVFGMWEFHYEKI